MLIDMLIYVNTGKVGNVANSKSSDQGCGAYNREVEQEFIMEEHVQPISDAPQTASIRLPYQCN